MFMMYLLRRLGTDRETLGVQSMRKLLWGYPDLMGKLYNDVRPMLIDVSEKKGREKEQEQWQKPTTEHVTAPLAALADGSGGSTSVTQNDAQPDRGSDIYTLAPDGRSQSAESERKDPLKPASQEPNQRLNIYGVGKRSKSQEGINRGSRREQSEE